MDTAAGRDSGAHPALGIMGIASLAGLTPAHAQEAAPASAPAELPSVVVTSQRSTLDTLPEKILDTPQSINVISPELLSQQAGTSLSDALKNVPGITLNAGEGGTHGDLVNIRGFSAGDDYFMDGLRDTGLYDRDAFDYESLEVYKGPASTLFGRGSTGGVINQVMKTPLLTPLLGVTATAGTNSELRATGDFNYPFADHAAVRLNIMGQKNLTEGRPFAETRRWGIAPAIAFGLDTDTTGWLKLLHQQEDNLPDYGIPFLFDRPAPVSPDTFYGLPTDDRFKTKVDVLTGRIQHSFSSTWSISDTARYGHYDFLSRQTAAIYGTGNCFPSSATPGYFAGAPVCAAGNVASQVPVTPNNPYFPTLGTPLSDIYVLRDRPSSRGTIETAMNDLDITGRFSTLALQHILIFGLEYDNESADLTRYVNQNTVIAPALLLDPDPYEAFPGTQTAVSQTPDTDTDTKGAYLGDTISFGPQWQLTGAVRYDDFRASFNQLVPPSSHFEHTDTIWSPRAALVFKPGPGSSIYFTYGTSFNPSAEDLALSASDASLPPEKDRTFELGAKQEALNDLLAVTEALFDTEMTNARITDPDEPTLQTLAGTERVKGAELDIQGHITRNWEVVAGYTYLSPTAVGLAGAGIEGPIPNTTHNQANLWTSYSCADGLELATGLNYSGPRFAGTDNMTVPGLITVPTVPGYVTWDAMIGYRVNSRVTVRVNGLNLTNRFYYMNSYFTRPEENHSVPGPGRTVLLTASLSM